MSVAVLTAAGSACGGNPASDMPVPSPTPSGDVAPAAAAHDSAAAAPRASVPRASEPPKPAKAPSKRPPAPAPKPVARPPRPAPDLLPAQARTPLRRPAVDSTALEFAVTARLAHEPLTRAIARRTRNPELAERAAWAVTREAGRLRMSPSLLAAVLLVENRQLDSAAVSSQGAIGLMQVMPMHAGSYGCESADLLNVDANICHGARILHLYLMRSRSVTLALRRYNGCVRGANTPRCYRYPVRVLATAGRLRRDILASAAPEDRRVRM
jgi:soluble lytic murein transglycosylase-like protein